MQQIWSFRVHQWFHKEDLTRNLCKSSGSIFLTSCNSLFRKGLNGRAATFRGGRNIYLTHSISGSDEDDKQDVTRQEKAKTQTSGF